MDSRVGSGGDGGRACVRGGEGVECSGRQGGVCSAVPEGEHVMSGEVAGMGKDAEPGSTSSDCVVECADCVSGKAGVASPLYVCTSRSDCVGPEVRLVGELVAIEV